MTDREKLTVLRGIDLLHGLEEEHFLPLADSVQIRQYRKNQVIFGEGEPAEALFFILEGKVRLFRSSPDGRELTLYIRKPGESFAGATLFGGGTYPATSVTLEPSRLGMLKRQEFERLIVENGHFALQVIRLFGARLRWSHDQLRDMVLNNRPGAFASVLLRMAKDHGQAVEGGILIDLPLTQNELATFIGSSRENINRMLNDFKKDGLIALDKGKILLKDLQGLESFKE